MQHPTAWFLRSDMLVSVWRWTGGIPDTDIPIETTIASMDVADVGLVLLSAWCGLGGQDLICNYADCRVSPVSPEQVCWLGYGQRESSDGGGPRIATASP